MHRRGSDCRVKDGFTLCHVHFPVPVGKLIEKAHTVHSRISGAEYQEMFEFGL